MKKTIIDKVKGLFGSGFRKKVAKADSLKQLRKRLDQKKDQLEKKIVNCNSATERKLLEKKIRVLHKQIRKIDDKLGK